MSRRGDFRDPDLLHDRYITEQLEDVYYGYTPGEEGEPIPDSERDAEGYFEDLHRDDPNDHDPSDPDDTRYEREWAAERRWGHNE